MSNTDGAGGFVEATTVVTTDTQSVVTKSSSTNSPSTNANDIANQSYIALNIENLPKVEGGYYSKYNTQASQTFGGAVADGLVQGAIQALPETFKTDVQVLSDFRLGTFLRRKGVISGDQASLVDGVIDFIREDEQSTSNFIVPKFTYNSKFIPIVIKTEFKIQAKSDSSGRDNFYIIFDSTPDTISLGKNATWVPKDFFGRPEPIQVYQSSGAITFSLSGKFFSDSPKDHLEKMKLENRLFALVTPSKNHFMPSPVEVRIGEWKRLRCVVNSVNIKYQGPWRMTAGADSSSVSGSKSREKISALSHSPYIYDVDFSFTVVSEFNTVQYAEDIMDVGHNGGYSTSSDTQGYADIAKSADSNEKYKNLAGITIGDNNTSIIYNIQGQAGEEGTVVDSSAIFANTTEYLTSLGLPTDSNGASKLAGMAEITSGLTAIVETSLIKNYGKTIAKVFGK